RFHAKDEVLHIFRTSRPGQVRGIPWFAPAMMTARELSDFMDSVLVKAHAEACFAGFIENQDDLSPIMDAAPTNETFADSANPNAQISTIEPGTIKLLGSGQKITFAQPTTTSQVEPVFLFSMQAIASAVGCTYDQATGDLRQAIYSSLRAGRLDHRRLVEQLQYTTLIPDLCLPVWNKFIDRAVLAGQIPARKMGSPCTGTTPSWEPINPKYDLDAEEHSVRSGRTSPQNFIASWG